MPEPVFGEALGLVLGVALGVDLGLADGVASESSSSSTSGNSLVSRASWTEAISLLPLTVLALMDFSTKPGEEITKRWSPSEMLSIDSGAKPLGSPSRLTTAPSGLVTTEIEMAFLSAKGSKERISPEEESGVSPSSRLTTVKMPGLKVTRPSQGLRA